MAMKNLYIHIPFCDSKCSYCDFYSVTNGNIEEYLSHLITGFKKQRHLVCSLETIYIGGGTPTYLSAKQLDLLFKSIFANFATSKDIEVTIECNPETLTIEKFKIIANFATRISFGVQTFNQPLRNILGRKGEIKSIYNAIDLLQKYDFINYNFDFIYAIPNQTIEMLQYDLNKAIQLNAKHISAYSLTIEENAKLAKNGIVVDDDESANMWNFIRSYLKEYKFEQYEISNYAKLKYESKHNQNIWHGETYLGCGTSASSFDGVKRWTEVANIQKWMQNVSPKDDIISRKKRVIEVFIFGLRTTKGWTEKDFFKITDFDFTIFKNSVKSLVQEKLLEYDIINNRIYPTTKGLLFWNYIAENILNL